MRGWWLLLAASGCQLVFGLDEPQLEPGSGAGATSAGGNGSGGGGGEVGGNAGGGGATECPECPGDCFEQTCQGYLPVALAPGGQVSCVIVKSGSVWCFGSNRFGGLGAPIATTPDTCSTSITNGTSGPCSHSARRVEGLPGAAVDIATGHHAACAVLADGELWCWGRNDRGLLGHIPDGSDESCSGVACRTAPTHVEGLPAVSSVRMSEKHACAVAGADVWCWGLNDYGQLGNGAWVPGDINAVTPSMVSPPAAVAGKIQPLNLSLASNHTCVGSVPLSVSCFGENSFGALGFVGSSSCNGVDCVLEPTEFPGLLLDNKLAIATPRGASCFRSSDGSLSCAGYNGWSFLGSAWDGGVHETTTELAPASANVVTVRAGDAHLCYLTLAGEVHCWGGNFMGQLGRGTVGGDTACADGLPCEAAPAPVVGLEASLLSVGNNVNLALRSDGVLVGWGMNQGAQLGHPPSTGPDVPCAFYDTTPDDVHCAPTPTPVEGLPVAE